MGQTLKPVGGTFSSPVHAAAPPGDGHRLMVTEQGGTVRVIRDGQTLATPFLTLDTNLSSGGERGLLSIAFRPDYEQSRLLYAYYTDAEGDIRVDEFRRAASSRDVTEPGYRRSVIEIPHREAANHNGGQLQFGPDGFLYLGPGDGGNGYDEPFRDARDLGSLLGKLLRIDPIPGGGYRIPPGNPYAGAEGTGPPRRDEIWAYGLRNPFRFSFDRRGGDLLIADVGQSRVEEIDFAAHVPGVGAGRGLNFGWDDCEGSFRAEPKPTGTAPCDLAGDTLPIKEHLRPGSGFCSITGGYVVRDPALESLAGRYLYGDFCYDAVRSLSPASPADDRREDTLRVSELASFGEDACGRLYTVERGGTVSRVEDASPGRCDLEPGGGPATPRPLTVDLAGSRRQRALRRGAVLVRVGCDRACGIRALGRLSIRRRGRNLGLRQARARLSKTGRVTLRLRLTRRSRPALRRALGRRRRVSARLTIRVRGAGGQLVVKRRLVRVVR